MQRPAAVEHPHILGCQALGWYGDPICGWAQELHLSARHRLTSVLYCSAAIFQTVTAVRVPLG